MKRLLPFALLLLSLHAEAQIVGSVRQTHGPYERPAAGYEPALTSTRKSVLLAWSERDPGGDASRVHYGLLDFRGYLVSAITIVPSIGRTESPAVATDGTNFRLVYYEYRPENRIDRRYAMAVDIDAAGNIIGGPSELHVYDRAAPATFPIVYWNGSSFTQVDRPIDEAAIAIDEHLSSVAWTQKRVLTGCFLFVCRFDDVVELDWFALNGVNGSYRPSIAEPGALAISGKDRYAAIAWSTSRGVQYLQLVDGKRVADPTLLPASVPTNDRPGLGCDDTHCLLVYATRAGDIYGALFGRNQGSVAAAVPIELGAQFSKPHVQVLENGRFLVTYVSAPFAVQSFMAGRIVTTEQEPIGRRRAVR